MKSRVTPPTRSLAIWLITLHTALVIAVWVLRDSPLMSGESPLMVLPLILGAADSPLHALLSSFRSISLTNDYIAMLLGLGGLYWGLIGYGLGHLLAYFNRAGEVRSPHKKVSPAAQTGGPVRHGSA